MSKEREEGRERERERELSITFTNCLSLCTHKGEFEFSIFLNKSLHFFSLQR
jgi:hypothetical protein